MELKLYRSTSGWSLPVGIKIVVFANTTGLSGLRLTEIRHRDSGFRVSRRKILTTEWVIGIIWLSVFECPIAAIERGLRLPYLLLWNDERLLVTLAWEDADGVTFRPCDKIVLTWVNVRSGAVGTCKLVNRKEHMALARFCLNLRVKIRTRLYCHGKKTWQ